MREVVVEVRGGAASPDGGLVQMVVVVARSRLEFRDCGGVAAVTTAVGELW
jgi:hypothetical protein